MILIPQLEVRVLASGKYLHFYKVDKAMWC